MALTSLQKALIGAGTGVGAGVLLYYLSQRARVAPPRVCEEGDVRTKTCWDGSVIETARCVDGRWVGPIIPTKCPPRPECEEGEEKTKTCPERKCKEGDVRAMKCPDGTTVVTYRCIGGEWMPTGMSCRGPHPIPI